MKISVGNLLFSRIASGGNPLANALWQYFNLKQKLDHPEQQSWYFQKGVESQKNALESHAARFEKYRDAVNSDNLDDIVEQKNKLENDLKMFDA